MNDKEIMLERKKIRYAKALKKASEEYAQEMYDLRQRDDYLQEFEYFLELISEPFSVAKLRDRVKKPIVGLFCIQAPLELFDAFGLHAVKLCSGSQTVQRIAASYLPVLMCPMLKSFMGNFEMQQDSIDNYKDIIVPTTCDWVVKLPEIMQLPLENIYFLELPHVKDKERSQQRWFEEILALKEHLQQLTGIKLTRDALEQSINKYMHIWILLDELNACKRQGYLSGVWYTLITNTFMHADAEEWARHVKKLLTLLKKKSSPYTDATVFVAGSPVVFPNLKLLQLIEKAGMRVVADDLCSSERIMPGGIIYADCSMEGMLKALAERYHKACICPTFTDNSRRINSILSTSEEYGIKGVVFNLLKGCHPYDIEAVTIERKIKECGLKFIKIETDYGKEDSQNILTRLEAFKQTL